MNACLNSNQSKITSKMRDIHISEFQIFSRIFLSLIYSMQYLIFYNTISMYCKWFETFTIYTINLKQRIYYFRFIDISQQFVYDTSSI